MMFAQYCMMSAKYYMISAKYCMISVQYCMMSVQHRMNVLPKNIEQNISKAFKKTEKVNFFHVSIRI